MDRERDGEKETDTDAEREREKETHAHAVKKNPRARTHAALRLSATHPRIRPLPVSPASDVIVLVCLRVGGGWSVTKVRCVERH